MSTTRAGGALVCLLLLAGCVSAPPGRPDDICAVFAERPAWREAAKESEARWGTPTPVVMAFLRHESGFRADARPPRKRLLGIVPWTRPSSAFGYAQATDETWEDYLRDVGGGMFTRRDDFEDSADFVGWYNARSRKHLGIPADDTYRLYLAYHEGLQGYRSGSWRGKTWLQNYARTVTDRARRYAGDLGRCP